MMGVSQESPKPCKYLQRGTTCQFAEVGCMFDHKESDPEDDEEEVQGDQSKNDDELENSFCYLFERRFSTQCELIAHMGDKPLDGFPHMMFHFTLAFICL
jgi:hypothetical protein